MDEPRNYRPLIAAGITLGVGLGGFVDGILFLQILQVHNMLSAIHPKTTLVNAEINMFWDGIFHSFAWITTVVGLCMLWSAVRRDDVPLSTRTLIGSMLLGWGLFNLVEGVVVHHVLNLHHVVERLGVSAYDWAFLASALLFILIGLGLIRTDMARETHHAVPGGSRRRGNMA